MLIVKHRRYGYAAIIIIIVAVFAVLWFSLFRNAAAAERSILFPILGGGSYTNDFNAPRSNGQHGATDVFAAKHTPLVAAVDGEITFAGYPQPSWGYMVQITDADGYQYNYIHMNNDTPGTDDGRGDGMNAYAPDMKRGNRVVKGQFVGWVGDSGNAENTPPHLHFEIVRPDGSLVNPYEVLREAPIRYSLPNRAEYPSLPNEVLPYGGYEIGINIAAGNFDADPAVEVVTGAGIRGGPHVKIYNANMTFTGSQFFAYNAGFTGGVDVAAGDVDGDGIDEVITGAGPGGGPHVKAIKPDGTVIASFFAYDPKFDGGVYVAAGDVDGDGVDEIVTGAGVGGGPNVKIFEANGTQIGSFFPYTDKFRGGVDVAVGDVRGDSKPEIVTSAGPGGGPHVRVVTYVGNTADPVQYNESFYAYDPNTYHGGSRVAVGNVQTGTSKAEIITAPHTKGGPHIKMFNTTGTVLTGKMFMEEWWYGYHDIAAADGFSLAATGNNRRASVRSAF